MKKILIALIIVILITPKAYSNWLEIEIIDLEDDLSMFYNDKAISKINDQELTINILFNSNSDMSMGQKGNFKSVIFSNIVDCKKRMYRTQISHTYSESMGKGYRKFAHKNNNTKLSNFGWYLDNVYIDRLDELKELTKVYNKECKNIFPNLRNKPIVNITPAEVLDNFPRMESLKNNFKSTCVKYNKKSWSHSGQFLGSSTNLLKLKKDDKKNYLNALAALNERKLDKSLMLINNLLLNEDLKAIDKALLYRLKGFNFGMQGEYNQQIKFFNKALCLNVLTIRDQIELHYSLIEIFKTLEEPVFALNEINQLINYYKNILDPSIIKDNIHQISRSGTFRLKAEYGLINIYLALYSPKNSLAQKHFIKIAKPYVEDVFKNSLSPSPMDYYAYLELLKYEKKLFEYKDVLKKLAKIDSCKGYRDDEYSYELSKINKELGLSETEELSVLNCLPVVINNEWPNPPNTTYKKDTNGWVLIETGIDKKGNTINPEVIDYSPTDIFNKYSIDAVKKTTYDPSSVHKKDGLKAEYPIQGILLQYRFFHSWYSNGDICPIEKTKKPLFYIPEFRNCLYTP